MKNDKDLLEKLNLFNEKGPKPEVKEKLVCDDCGCDKGVEETICPYAQEIHYKEIECNLCGHCYSERCMDI